MRIFHSNESFVLASFLPPKKRGNRERMGARIGHSHLNEKLSFEWDATVAQKMLAF